MKRFIVSLNCKMSETDSIIKSRILNLAKYGIYMFRINLKSFLQTDIDRVKRLIRLIHSIDKNFFRIYIDIPYPKTKPRLIMNSSKNVKTGDVISIYSINSTQISNDDDKVYLNQNIILTDKFSKDKTIYFADGRGSFMIVKTIHAFIW